MPDLHFYRDPEEIEQEEQATAEMAVAQEDFQGEWTALVPEFSAAQVTVTDRVKVQVLSAPLSCSPLKMGARPSARPLTR